MEQVQHEIPPLYDGHSKILILGSFPSVKSREGHFFYNHPQNIIVTDPLTGESSKRGMNDSTQQFADLGNLFLVCLPETEN